MSSGTTDVIPKDDDPAGAAGTDAPLHCSTFKYNQEEGINGVCCMEFTQDRIDTYDEKLIEFKNKPFVKDTVWCFFYIPLNFGSVMNRCNEKMKAVEADETLDETILLSDMTSRWTTRIYISSRKDAVPGAEVVTMSGKFWAKVFEGDYSHFGEWCEQMKVFLKSKEGEDFEAPSENWFAYYTTCPKCAAKFGKNYTVLMVKVKD